MLYQELLLFKDAVERRCGKIIRITFDETGKAELLKEMKGRDPSVFDGSVMLGIQIDAVKNYPTCGRELEIR